MTSTSTAPPTIPQPERISPSLTVQAPLTGRGYGPGIVIVSLASVSTDASHGEHIDPAPQQKWAEEGYVVAHLKLSEGFTVLRIRDELREATEALSYHDKCTSKSTYGIIGKSTP
jgi:carboxymethylenebutenolidase